jgi:hypothetical protein
VALRGCATPNIRAQSGTDSQNHYSSNPNASTSRTRANHPRGIQVTQCSHLRISLLHSLLQSLAQTPANIQWETASLADSHKLRPIHRYKLVTHKVTNGSYTKDKDHYPGYRQPPESNASILMHKVHNSVPRYISLYERRQKTANVSQLSVKEEPAIRECTQVEDV